MIQVGPMRLWLLQDLSTLFPWIAKLVECKREGADRQLRLCLGRTWAKLKPSTHVFAFFSRGTQIKKMYKIPISPSPGFP